MSGPRPAAPAAAAAPRELLQPERAPAAACERGVQYYNIISIQHDMYGKVRSLMIFIIWRLLFRSARQPRPAPANRNDLSFFVFCVRMELPCVVLGRPEALGCRVPLSLQRLGVDLSITPPVWDSNLRPPASESRSLTN